MTRAVPRPLLICDCDEVILHMVSHFRDWLGEAHSIDFAFEQGDWAQAMTHRANGALVEEAQIWPLLEQFFRTEMRRQTVVPGAREALGKLSDHGDVIILTNIGEEAGPLRQAHLDELDIAFEVVGNRGGKGRRVMELLKRFNPSHAVFVDDLPSQIASVAKHAPGVKRLHMVSEPALAPAVPPADGAHARIDDWGAATDWIFEQWSITP